MWFHSKWFVRFSPEVADKCQGKWFNLIFMYHLQILRLSLAPSFSTDLKLKITNCYKVREKLRNFGISAFNVNKLLES